MIELINLNHAFVQPSSKHIIVVGLQHKINKSLVVRQERTASRIQPRKRDRFLAIYRPRLGLGLINFSDLLSNVRNNVIRTVPASDLLKKVKKKCKASYLKNRQNMTARFKMAFGSIGQSSVNIFLLRCL
jgi:hypothetical protein